MILISIIVRENEHVKQETLEFAQMGPGELSRVEEMAHTLNEWVERIGRRQAAEAARRAGADPSAH